MRKIKALILVLVLGTVAWFVAVPSNATPINHSFVTGYVSVDEVSVVVSQNSKTLTAECPEGLHVLGGGGNTTNVSQFAIHASYPSSDDTAWTVRWQSPGGQADGTFTVTALCGNTD